MLAQSRANRDYDINTVEIGEYAGFKVLIRTKSNFLVDDHWRKFKPTFVKLPQVNHVP